MDGNLTHESGHKGIKEIDQEADLSTAGQLRHHNPR